VPFARKRNHLRRSYQDGGLHGAFWALLGDRGRRLDYHRAVWEDRYCSRVNIRNHDIGASGIRSVKVHPTAAAAAAYAQQAAAKKESEGFRVKTGSVKKSAAASKGRAAKAPAKTAARAKRRAGPPPLRQRSSVVSRSCPLPCCLASWYICTRFFAFPLLLYAESVLYARACPLYGIAFATVLVAQSSVKIKKGFLNFSHLIVCSLAPRLNIQRTYGPAWWLGIG
jgi:hypothetical protein